MFMCQRNSMLTEYSTQVLSCKPVDDESSLRQQLLLDNLHGNIYEVILDDTILFPEGGGQPDDHGLINQAEVLRVLRNGIKAVHYVKVDNNGILFKEGETVSVKLDWIRRFDHMQQHSGQHLITAITDQLYGFNTTSWWLGSNDSTSYIELDTKEVTDAQIQTIEDKVNQKIRDAIPVTVEVVELDDPKLNTARGRNLPEDVKGQIRIVSINGVENNVCCGTHVSCLSQLQVVKLLFAEKKKGKCLLHFLVGNRVVKKLGVMFQREQVLTQRLSSPASELVSAAEKLNLSLKTTKKAADIFCKDLAKLEAKVFLNNQGSASEKFWHYHRDNVELDFTTALLREIGPTDDTVILVTIKVEGNSGHLILRGAENVIDSESLVKLGNEVCTLLNGKGILRGNLFQAKVSKISNASKVPKVVKEFILALCKNS